MKKHVSLLLSAVLGITLAFTSFASSPVTASAATVPSNANLLNTYKNVFGKVGTTSSASAFFDGNTRQLITKEYNSYTAENEMKPDAILGSYAQTISVSQAKSMGYYIPYGYSESTVPKLNFSTVDNLLKTCYENGLSMRGHTLVWHSQTPDWFFRYGYNANNAYVDQNTMNKRMEFFIKSYMGHVCSSQYSSVVYAWDVVNEFLHASNSGWQKIYGNPSPYADFIKQAFRYAYDTLSYFKQTDKVKLFYNDYNTYMEVDDVIKLINNINSSGKICAGVGMQSHLTTSFPSVAYYKNALSKFRQAGFEIQVTELDVGCTSEYTQAQYYYDLMTAILEEKKAGANITALVFWGLCDNTSWRKNEKPLLYSNYNVKKPAYDKVLQAYFDAGYTLNGGNNNNNQTPVYNGTLSDGWYYIKNVHAQKYLQVTNNSGTNAQNVELGTGTGVKGQKWYLKNLGNGYFTLQNGLGNFMLDIANGANSDGANAQIYSAYSGDPQQFTLKAGANGTYSILTKCSNNTKALDAYNWGTSNGTNICQWTYGGGNNQLWVFEKTNN